MSVTLLSHFKDAQNLQSLHFGDFTVSPRLTVEYFLAKLRTKISHYYMTVGITASRRDDTANREIVVRNYFSIHLSPFLGFEPTLLSLLRANEGGATGLG